MDCASTTTVRDCVLGLLRSFGINTIFGNPGSTELPMFRRVDRPDALESVLRNALAAERPTLVEVAVA
jgi:benzoylformate decarboxylase